MQFALSPAKAGRRVGVSTIIGLLVAPLLAAAVLLWGLWYPTDRLHSVRAAVVNLDEPVTVDGQLVPLGRLLAGNLIGPAGDAEDAGSGKGSSGNSGEAQGATTSAASLADHPNFDWVLTDAADAKAGLASGEYLTVVTIPKNFSSAATSASRGADAAEQAHITVQPTARGRLLDNALSTVVTQAAVAALNQTLGTQYVGKVFVGMTQLRTGLTDAQNGAAELHSGQSELATGATQLVTGLSTLRTGADSLHSGLQSTSAGASQLAYGAATVDAGASSLSSGAAELATGATALQQGTGQLTQGLQGLAGSAEAGTGLAALASGLEQYSEGARSGLEQLRQLTDAAQAPLQQLRDGIEADVVPLQPGQDKQQVLAQLDTVIAGLQRLDSTDPAVNPLQPLLSGGEKLLSGAQEAAAGASALAGAASQVDAGVQKLATGAQQLASGAAQLREGTAGVSSGASALADGTAQLTAGSAQLTGGMPQLVSGAQQLANGQKQAADGSAKLADGLRSAADQIPNYTEAQSNKLAGTMIAPVAAEASTDDLFTGQGAPLFAALALWAGALGTFTMLSPLWRRTREAALGNWRIALRSALPAAGIGALQGALVGGGVVLALRAAAGNPLVFIALCVLAGAAFSVLVQGLVALFGWFGRFVVLLTLFVALAAGILATVPAALGAIDAGIPLHPLVSALRATAAGDGGASSAAALLGLWAAAGYVLVLLGVARERARTD